MATASSVYANALVSFLPKGSWIGSRLFVPEDALVSKPFIDKAHEWAFPYEKSKNTIGVQSVFCRLNLNVPDKIQNNYFVRQRSLRLPDDAKDWMPPGEVVVDATTEQAIWNAFENDVKQFEHLSDNDAFVDALLEVMQCHLTAIPSGYVEYPELSLFDVAKLVSGLAVCFFQAEESGVSTEEPVMLVKGDVSGIQSFIYDIISKYAAKNLKGRSFYLHLLSDTVLNECISAVKAFRAQVVYASGGSFFLLAANTKENQVELKKVENRVSLSLFASYRLSLSFMIQHVPLSRSNITGSGLSEVFSSLALDSEIKKKRRFNPIITKQFEELFDESKVDYGAKPNRFDSITGEPLFEDGGQNYKIADDAPNPVKVKGLLEDIDYFNESTAMQIRAGNGLRSFDYCLTSSKNLFDVLPNGVVEILVMSKWHYFFSNRIVYEEDFSVIRSRIENEKVQIRVINKWDVFLSAPEDFGSQHHFSFEWYGGNDTPKNSKGEVKNFSDLAGGKNTNLKRLGILRMDVDNLGALFQKGFGDRVNLALYSNLSRQLDWFFKGYLNTLWETVLIPYPKVYKLNTQRVGIFDEDDENLEPKQNDHLVPLRNWTQIIYSGGDDLFIVGKWDILLQFSEIIRKNFKKYAAYNSDFGLSGGMAIVPHKFPVIKAAKLSEELEKKAKSHKSGKNNRGATHDEVPIFEKDSIAFLGRALHWSIEYPTIKWFKELFLEIDNPSLLAKIRSYYFKSKEDNSRLAEFRWRWMLAYEIGRMSPKRNSRLDDCLVHLKIFAFTGADNSNNGKMLFGSTLTDLEALYLASRWAELEIRSL